MKSMRKIATKIAGIALATAMMVGSMAVFAANNGDQVYSESFTVTATRDYIWEFFDYNKCTKTMTVPETGNYTVTITTSNPGDYYKDIRIYDADGHHPLTSQGPWDSSSLTYSQIDFQEGVEYTICAYADDYMGITIDTYGSVTFTVTLTLEEKFEEEIIPEDEEEDEEIPEDTEETEEEDTTSEEPEEPETPDEVTTTETTVENIAPAAPILTAEQIRALAVRNFVGHLYIDGLGRRATEEEIDEWADKLMCDSITATEAASQILTSSELNDHDFDNEQIAAILDEVFDTDSESDTLAQLNNGASVASVIEQLADTDNWASRCAFYGVNV